MSVPNFNSLAGLEVAEKFELSYVGFGQLASEAPSLKTPLVFTALYAFLLAWLSNNKTNQFFAKF